MDRVCSTKEALLADANAALADPQWRRARVTGAQFDWWVTRRILPRPVRLVGRGNARGVIGEYPRDQALSILTALPYVCRDIRSLDVATCAAWVFGAPVPWGTVQGACERVYDHALAHVTLRGMRYGGPLLRHPVAGRGVRKQRVAEAMIEAVRGASAPSVEAARYARAHVDAVTAHYGVGTKTQGLPLLLPVLQRGLSVPGAREAIRSASEDDAATIRPILQRLLLAIWWVPWAWQFFIRSESGRVPTKTIRKVFYQTTPLVLGSFLYLRQAAPDFVSTLLKTACPFIDALSESSGNTIADGLMVVLKGRGKIVRLPK
jgi:hypothetical protein